MIENIRDYPQQFRFMRVSVKMDLSKNTLETMELILTNSSNIEQAAKELSDLMEQCETEEILNQELERLYGPMKSMTEV